MTTYQFQDTTVWQKRAASLIEMIQDVAPPGHPTWTNQKNWLDFKRHRTLFAHYVEELQRVKHWTDRWWQALIQTEMQRTPDYGLAVEQVKKRWPLGPAPTKKVITVVRSYWLACDQINKNVVPSARVPPEIFMLQWLIDGKEIDLAKFLSGFPCWPIGLDQEGNWI